MESGLLRVEQQIHSKGKFMAAQQPQALLCAVREGYGGTIKFDNDSISHKQAYAGTSGCFTCVGMSVYASLPS